ncbi:MAG: hypothetical protein ACT4O4_08815 [Nitrospiraceae bacterium]
MRDIKPQQVLDAVQHSFRRLVEKDGDLFDCPIEEHSCHDARKLHEVCVNHRLANHLEKEIIPVLGTNEAIFVDIEFNREGMDFKNTKIHGEDKRVRPDIIVHNRKTGPEKINFLGVERKKQGASQNEIEEDRQKIRALMEDQKYEYSFGLQVVYGNDGVKGELFFRSGTEIVQEAVLVQPSTTDCAHANDNPDDCNSG